jgi:catechol 2,3-dioxygenase-like lactoylglutathione lyase family enzyme
MYLDYAGVRVTRLAPAVKFFETALGLSELRRGKMPHGGIWVLMEDGVSHQRLELNWYPKGSKYDVPFVAGEGLDHLGVRVHNVAAAARRLKKAGARRRYSFADRGRVMVEYWEGPDGLWIELILDPVV